MKEPMKESVKENFDQLDQETRADYLYLYLVEGYTQDDTAKISLYGRESNTGYDVSACLHGYGYRGPNSGKYREGRDLTVENGCVKCDFIREDFVELVTKYPDIDDDEDLTRERLVDIMLRRKNLIEDEDVEEYVEENVEEDEEDNIFVRGWDIIKSCKEKISRKISVRKANEEINRKNDVKTDEQTDEVAIIGIISAVIGIILLFIFRKKIYAFILDLLPLVFLVLMVYLAYKFIRKMSHYEKTKKRKVQKQKKEKEKISISAWLIAGFCFVTAYSGFSNGGHLLLVLGFVVAGFACLKNG